MKDVKNTVSRVDHTLLKQDATWDEIRALIDDGIAFGTASVCIPPLFVKKAAEYSAGRLPICTVIGFPLGYSTAEVKCFETARAVADGADEIDMVIPVGLVKEGRYSEVLEEIRAVRERCLGKVLKVIIETCLLTDGEKEELCRIVSASGADYIKTSTGFSTGGATLHDIELMKAHVEPHLKIKAAGGISSLEDAERFIEAGADRLGTSRIVKILKEEKNG